MKSTAARLVVVSFPGQDPYRGQFEQEVRAAQERGSIRLLDHLFLSKTYRGEVVMRTSQPEGGTPLRRLLGIADGSATLGRRTLIAPVSTPGVKSEQVRELVEQMVPGEGMGLALFRDVWTERLGASLTEMGGALLDHSPLAADDLEASCLDAEEVEEPDADPDADPDAGPPRPDSRALDILHIVGAYPLAMLSGGITGPGVAVPARAHAILIAGALDERDLESEFVAVMEAGFRDPALTRPN